MPEHQEVLEELVRQFLQRKRLPVGRFQIALLLVLGKRPPVVQQPQIAEQRGHGRPDVVAHSGNEFAVCFPRPLLVAHPFDDRIAHAVNIRRKPGDFVAAVHGDVGFQVARADGGGLLRKADDAPGQAAGVPEQHAYQHHRCNGGSHAAVQHILTRAGVVGDGNIVDAVRETHRVEFSVSLITA